MNVTRELSPIVVLNRLSPEDVSSYSNSRSSTPSSKSSQNRRRNRQRILSSSEGSDSDEDDDLPQVRSIFNRECKNYGNRKNGGSQYHDILNEIYDRKHVMEKNQQCSVRLEEICSHLKDPKTNSVNPKEVLRNNELDLNFCGFESRISDLHPGEIIFDFSNSGNFFHQKQLVFRSPSRHKSPIDEWLKELSPDLLQMEIERGNFLLDFEMVYDKKALVRLLFRLMTIHESYSLGLQCKEVLCTVIKKDTECIKYISVKDILEVFLNYGSTFENLIPVPELQEIAKKLFTVNERHFPIKETERMSMLPEHCIEFLMPVLRACLLADNNRSEYNVNDLQILVILLCRVALDSHLRLSPAVTEIQLLLIDILDRFSEKMWPQVVITLAQHLCLLSDNPHNLVAVIRLMFNSERGCHLQRLASYCMIHKILELHLDVEGLTDVMPLNAVKLLLEIVLPMKRLNDHSLLYRLITLFDFCVNCDFSQGNWQKFKNLATILKRLEGSLKSEHDVDDSKVKDLIARISIKWQILASQMPVSQKTLFSYLTSSPLEQG